MDHKLEKFLAVVEAGGFTKAAESIHISQPALSVTINDLEAEIGASLLIRKRGHFGLTATGQIVYDTARRIRSDLQVMDRQLSEHMSQQARLRIGLLDTITSLILDTDLISGGLANIEMKVDNSSRLINEVRFGRLDIAFIAAQTSSIPAGVLCKRIGYEEFVFIASRDVAKVTDPKYIVNWLAFNQDSNTYAHFVKQFASQNITVLPSFYSTSMDLLKSMALRGKGVALLPAHFCRSEIEAGELAVIKTPSFKRPIWVAEPSDKRGSTTNNELIEYLSRMLSD